MHLEIDNYDSALRVEGEQLAISIVLPHGAVVLRKVAQRRQLRTVFAVIICLNQITLLRIKLSCMTLMA